MGTPHTDKTYLDDWLKERLYRDILFRAGLWLVVAALAAYLAFAQGGATALSYLSRISNAVLPVVNILGTVGLALCVIALMLKDLEYVAPQSWGYSTRRGKIGGLIRRIAGDLTLWALGSLTAVVAVAIVVITVSAEGVFQAFAALSQISQLLLAVLGTAFANVMVRRFKPSPFIGIFGGQASVIFSYLLALSLVLALLLRQH